METVEIKENKANQRQAVGNTCTCKQYMYLIYTYILKTLIQPFQNYYITVVLSSAFCNTVQYNFCHWLRPYTHIIM